MRSLPPLWKQRWPSVHVTVPVDSKPHAGRGLGASNDNVVHRDDATQLWGADDEVRGESSQRRFVLQFTEGSKEPDYNFELYKSF